MSKVLTDIPHLEDIDVDDNFILKNSITSGKQSFIMIYGTFCGYCKVAYPEIQKLSKNNKDTFVAAIQIDSKEETVKKLVKRMYKKFTNEIPGVPTFILIQPNGQYSIYNGKRKYEHFKKFIDNN